MNLRIEKQELAPGTVRHALLSGDAAVGYGDVLERLRAGDDSLIELLCATFSESTYEAFLWETPAITRDTLERPFEFVLIESRTLAQMPSEPEVFRAHLRAASAGIATFANLSGDAVLVAPRSDTGSSYAHLALFSRHAPLSLQRSLWSAVGEAVRIELDERPLWISTSGLGVAWLHVRLDGYPKYYHHAPYREL